MSVQGSEVQLLVNINLLIAEDFAGKGYISIRSSSHDSQLQAEHYVILSPFSLDHGDLQFILLCVRKLP